MVWQEEEQLHLNVGLNKIAETVGQVEEMQKSLAVKSAELQAKNEMANAKLKQMARSLIFNPAYVCYTFKSVVKQSRTWIINHRLVISWNGWISKILFLTNFGLFQVKDQQEAEKQKAHSQEIQKLLEIQKVEIATKKTEVMADLDKVEPAVIEAQQAVKSIRKQHLVITQNC